MIVEDEAITQRYLKNILSQHGIKVIDCYDNAKDALLQVKLNHYDMILMDINISGSVDGIQLAREILRSFSIPIIFITAHNDTDTFEEVLELSPYGFIAKPFSAADVEVSVKLAYKRYLDQYNEEKNKTLSHKNDIVVINKMYTYSKDMEILYCGGEEVKLNIKQKRLIDILCRNINDTVNYDRLLSNIWDEMPIADSALRTLVYSIRKQLPDFPLISHSKVGYCIKQDM